MPRWRGEHAQLQPRPRVCVWSQRKTLAKASRCCTTWCSIVQQLYYRLAMAFKIHTKPASADRVPIVEAGEAIVYTRYEKEKTVAVNPDDFRRLAQLEVDLDEISASDHIALDDFALEGLIEEARPKQPIEDAAQIEAVLGL